MIAFEERQHEAVLSVVKRHFGHSSTEMDMEDASWAILNELEGVTE